MFAGLSESGSAFVLKVERFAICFFSPVKNGVRYIKFYFVLPIESEIPPFPYLLKIYFSNDNELKRPEVSGMSDNT